MDEVTDLNERVDVRMEEVEGDVGTLKEDEGAERSSWSVESSSRQA